MRIIATNRVIAISVLVIAAAVGVIIVSMLTFQPTIVTWRPVVARLALASLLPMMLVLEARITAKQIAALLLILAVLAAALIFASVVSPAEIMIFVIGLGGVAVHARHRRT